MGHKDLDNLHKIYRQIQYLNKTKGWYFAFKVDDGDYETRIDIRLSDGSWSRGNGGLPLIGWDMKCPDLIDFNRKIIIEFEEEAKPNKGDRRIKGHFPEVLNPRDQERDDLYAAAGFHLHKIWASDFKDESTWTAELEAFLKIYA